MTDRLKRDWPLFIVSVFFALIQFRMIMAFFQKEYFGSVDAAFGVLSGHPHWIVYQNRILGPWLISGIDHFTHNYAMAYALFSVAMITMAGMLAAILGQRVGSGPGSAIGFLVFQVTFVMLLSHPWLYAWDYLSLVFLLLFIILVHGGRSWPWFVALFCVAIFNRDDALFIAIWLILDPLLAWVRSSPEQRACQSFPWRPITAGIACVVAGRMVILQLRQSLLVEEIGPKLWGHVEGYGVNYHLKIYTNLRQLDAILTNPDFSMAFLVPAFIGLVAAAAVWLAVKNPGRWLALALVHLGMLAATFCFGEMMETRVYLVFIPLLVLAVTSFHHRCDQR